MRKKFGVMTFGVVTTLVFGVMLLPQEQHFPLPDLSAAPQIKITVSEITFYGFSISSFPFYGSARPSARVRLLGSICCGVALGVPLG